MAAADRRAVDLAVGAVTTGLNAVEDVGLERLVGQVDQVLRRVERLEQRARVVEEHVGHLAGREAGLDDVVALAAARTRLDLDLDVGVLRPRRRP